MLALQRTVGNQAAQRLLANQASRAAAIAGAPAAIRRAPGQLAPGAARGPLLQRDWLSEWAEKSRKLPFKLIGKPAPKPVTPGVIVVDNRVAGFNGTYSGAIKGMNAYHATQALNNLLKDIEWLTSQPEGQVWGSALTDLRKDVVKKLTTITPELERLKTSTGEETWGRFEQFRELPDEMAEFASRPRDVQPEAFANPGESYKAMSNPRDADNLLTDKSMTTLETQDKAKAESSLYGKKDKMGMKGAGVDLSKITPEQIDALLEQTKRADTGHTEFPELANLAEGTAEAEPDEVEEVKDAGGVAVTLKYDRTDAMWQQRFGLVQAAVTQAMGAGFTIAPFSLHLPKYGREISISSTDGHTHTVTIGEDTAQAQFVAPNFMYINSRVFHNPKVDTGLSIKLDPSGIATIVHELGHMTHFTQSRAKYNTLSFSQLSGYSKQTGESFKQRVEGAVSKYGGGNPRELVAEVFLGLAYGKTFPDDVMAAYNAFGGPAQG
jgi:hypothetical protein